MNQSNQPIPPSPQRSPVAEVKTTPAIVAPFFSLYREVRGMVAVPFAFFGGLFGSIIVSAGLVGLMIWLENNASAETSVVDEEEFMLEFEPGALTKLGVEPKDMPEKPINEETRTPDEAVEEAVTEEEKPPEIEKEKKDQKEIKKDNQPVNKNEKAKISDKNRTDNNPYDNDLPNNLDPTGDPFGDPNGWADMKKDGDPWATSVMSALNNMKIPAWAAKLPAGKPYKFQLKICKDGTVETVYTKSSSGNADLDGAINGELQRLKIPKPPADVAKKMKANCVVLQYQFAWTQGKVK
ncbi:MAG: TonB C-terminal domain-containing protein [Myxococcales bacterium]|nr:TonB C-terminal domain-containing protein [Myxococcales bacterium]